MAEEWQGPTLGVHLRKSFGLRTVKENDSKKKIPTLHVGVYFREGSTLKIVK